MNDILTYKLLSLSNKNEWSDYLRRLPEQMQDIYFSPEYLEVYEKNGDGKAYCFVFEDEEKIALYPFLMNKINDLGYKLDDNYYDIQGAYGYNGVVYSSDDPEFITNFYSEFNDFCRENNIVAEFTRFHPIIKNYKFSEGYLNVIFNRQTVYFDLINGYDNIIKNYGRKVRRAIKSGAEKNITVKAFEKELPYLPQFIELYSETMDRVHAEKYIYFNQEYFTNLTKHLPVVQFVVLKEDVPIASSLCFYGKHLFHGHLAASKKEYFFLHPNEILFDAQVRFAIKKNKKICHIGGGRTTDPDDSLLHFKKHLSKSLSNFYIGTKVHNTDIFKQIIDQWEKKHPELKDAYQNTFLKYRNFLPKT